MPTLNDRGLKVKHWIPASVITMKKDVYEKENGTIRIVHNYG
jgi:hypothetical protein